MKTSTNKTQNGKKLLSRKHKFHSSSLSSFFLFCFLILRTLPPNHSFLQINTIKTRLGERKASWPQLADDAQRQSLKGCGCTKSPQGWFCSLLSRLDVKLQFFPFYETIKRFLLCLWLQFSLPPSPFWCCDVVCYDADQVFCHSTNSSSSTGPANKTTGTEIILIHLTTVIQSLLC